MTKPSIDNICFAYEQAASFLENEEWPGDDKVEVCAAYSEVAKRLRDTSTRIYARATRPRPTDGAPVGSTKVRTLP